MPELIKGNEYELSVPSLFARPFTAVIEDILFEGIENIDPVVILSVPPGDKQPFMHFSTYGILKKDVRTAVQI